MSEQLIGLLFGLPSMILQAVVYVSVWMIISGQMRMPRSPLAWYRANRRMASWRRRGRV